MASVGSRSPKKAGLDDTRAWAARSGYVDVLILKGAWKTKEAAPKRPDKDEPLADGGRCHGFVTLGCKRQSGTAVMFRFHFSTCRSSDLALKP
jgi:hypothetical protein